MTSMRETRIYDAFVQTSQNWDFMPSPAFAIAVLAIQFAVAVAFVFKGCNDKKWS